MKSVVSLLLLGSPALASILWDGRFNDISSSTDLLSWSFSNPVGLYQYYIHGSGNITEYVNLSSDFKNPADTASRQGAKISLTSTSYWNGQNMRRTELIPQTAASINKGKVAYHFSMKRSDTNAPSTSREHQIAFFESHFCEMKSGWVSGESANSNPNLQFFANSQSHWKVEWEADVWHNVAYEIDFSANTVAFWHSTGAAALTKVVEPVKVTASSNGADWHLGVLELQRSGFEDTDEDFFFSGVYVEDGDVTTSLGDGTASSGGPASSSVIGTSTRTATTSVATLSASSTSTPVTSSSPVSSSTISSSAVTVSTSASVTTAISSTLRTVVTSSTVSSTVASTTVTTSASITSTNTSSAPVATKTKSSCRRNRKRTPNGVSN